MINVVLHVAAEFGNQELFDRFHDAVLKEKDQRQRSRLLSALGAFRDPKLSRAGLELLLSKDFDPRESFFALLFGPLAYVETRELPFQFVKQNLDKLLARLPREIVAITQRILHSPATVSVTRRTAPKSKTSSRIESKHTQAAPGTWPKSWR